MLMSVFLQHESNWQYESVHSGGRVGCMMPKFERKILRPIRSSTVEFTSIKCRSDIVTDAWRQRSIRNMCRTMRVFHVGAFYGSEMDFGGPF